MGEHRPGSQHPEQYREDLNPRANAGMNYGLEGQKPGERVALIDIKEAHSVCQALDNDELRRVPVLREDTQLEQGATYKDLAHPGAPFVATADMTARKGQWIVARKEVDYELWNRLAPEEDGRDVR